MLLLRDMPAPSPVRRPELDGGRLDLTSFVPGTNQAPLSYIRRVIVIAPHAHEPQIRIRLANAELVRNHRALSARINDVATRYTLFFADPTVFVGYGFAAIIEMDVLHPNFLKYLHALALRHTQKNL